jgi:GLPGLI family protein
MKTLFIISLLIFSYKFILGQDYQYLITYDYAFQRDSTNINSVYTQKMFLFYSPTKSLFTSESRYKRDSILLNANGRRSDVNGSVSVKVSDAPSFVRNLPLDWAFFQIEKNFQDSLFYYHEVTLAKFKCQYDGTAISYQLVKQDSSIAGYTCSKATASLGGRNFVLWYTKEIPIPDGPYKFAGLPGLVLLAYDTEREHIFSVLSIEKKDTFFDLERNYQKSVELSMSKIAQLRYDIIAASQYGDIKLEIIDGDPEVLKKAKERWLKENNALELIYE